MEEQSRTYILEASDLSVSFETDAGEVQAVRDVSLSLKEGEVLAIVGESGCGKSVLCKSLMKMLPENARIKSGKILANGIDITGYKERDMAKLRGTLFSMVFQDPMTALNPTMTIGRQIEEAIKIHNPHIKRDALEKRVIELMGLVGIDQADERRNLYPYHFSGGMRQRSVLAIALAGNPSILIADETLDLLKLEDRLEAEIRDKFQSERFRIHIIGFAKMMGDIAEFFVQNKIKNFYSVSISGYHIAEAGANPISQLDVYGTSILGIK
jgi:ABC-type dipeptide/oligopeptide/nickel transport system ATPase component